MAKKQAVAEQEITPDENLDSEVAGLTPNPFEQVVAPTSQNTPQQPVHIEFKQEAFKDATKFSQIFGNLSKAEANQINAMMVANADKQPETRIHLFLIALEAYGEQVGRVAFK
jgi:hypothetical protein